MFKNKYGVGKNRSSLVLFFAIVFHSGITQDTAPPINVADTMESAHWHCPEVKTAHSLYATARQDQTWTPLELFCVLSPSFWRASNFFIFFFVLALQEEPEDGDGAGTERVEARLKQNYAFQPGFVFNVIYTI